MYSRNDANGNQMQYTPNQYNYTTHEMAMNGNTIYVNKNRMLQPPHNVSKPQVLVNPNFSRQVHVNPNFANAKKPPSTVFVNPNVFKSTAGANMHSAQSVSKAVNEPSDRNPSAMHFTQAAVGRVTSTLNNPNIYSKVNHIKNTPNHYIINKPNKLVCKRACDIESNKLTNKASSNFKVNYINTNVMQPCTRETHINNATVINTKTKLVRVQSTSTKSDNLMPPDLKWSSSSSTFVKTSPSDVSPSKYKKNNKIVNNKKPLVTKHKLIRNTKRISPMKPNFKWKAAVMVINSPIVKSKYKLINKGVGIKPRQQSTLRSVNRFKLDRRQSCTIIKSPMKLTKKAYMMRLDPQNTIIKNTTFKFVRGALNSSKTSANMKLKSPLKKVSRNGVVVQKKKRFQRNLVLINKKKLHKNNIPCEMYNRKGICKGLANGKCSKKHDPNQIQICIWFLQGICRDDNCTLSHKASPEKMPTCKFFLEGMCTKDKCPYLHVKLSKNAPICVDFLHGYCVKGLECDKRHQLLCPDFERDGSCTKKLCRYPHGKAVRQYKDTLLKLIARNKKAPRMEGGRPLLKKANNTNFIFINKKRDKIVDVAKKQEVDTKRYYECAEVADKVEHPTTAETEKTADVSDDEIPRNSIFDRPKLGTLPSFISF